MSLPTSGGGAGHPPPEDRHPQPDAHQDRNGDPAAAAFGNTPLQVDVELLHTASHISRHTSSSHLHTFYKTFDEVKDQKFDGLIITGGPGGADAL